MAEPRSLFRNRGAHHATSAHGVCPQPRGGKISIADQTGVDIVALDKALNELSAIDEQQGRIVELRFFGGLTIEDTSEVLGISPATVKRDWVTARAWLYRAMTGEAPA